MTLVEIKNKKVTAPTPQNTPINAAPISSQSIPTVPSISEEIETISTPGIRTVHKKFAVKSLTQNSLGVAGQNNPGLMSMLQGRLGNLISEPLPASVQRRVNGLKFLQSKHAELEGEFQKEV